MTDQMSVILTRPAVQSARFAQDVARALGAEWRIVIAPVLEIVETAGAMTLHTAAPMRVAAGLIFTSENAVRIFAAHCARRDLPAYCVGPRTARAAEAVGLTGIAGGGDVAGLIETIAAKPRPDGPLMHLRGVHVAGRLAETLTARGIVVDELVIYDQQACPLTEEAQRLLSGDGVVLLPLFSPRSATELASALSNARAELRIAAISPAVARAVRVQCDAQMEIAPRPDADAVLKTLVDLAGRG